MGSFVPPLTSCFSSISFPLSPVGLAGKALFTKDIARPCQGTRGEVWARQTINRKLIEENWDDLLRVAGSLKLGTVNITELLRALQGGGRLSTLAKAIAELGRIAKTLFLYVMWNRNENKYENRTRGSNNIKLAA